MKMRSTIFCASVTVCWSRRERLCTTTEARGICASTGITELGARAATTSADQKAHPIAIFQRGHAGFGSTNPACVVRELEGSEHELQPELHDARIVGSSDAAEGRCRRDGGARVVEVDGVEQVEELRPEL